MNYNINSKLKEKNEKLRIDYKMIQELIQKEFIDSCEKILIENKPKFIEDFFNKINLIIKNCYGEEVFQKVKPLNKILSQNKIDFINNLYFPMFKLCSLGIKLYNSKVVNNNMPKISFLINYRPHCMNKENNKNLNINTAAIHTCGGNLIIITENPNNNNYIKNNSFIICIKCKKCYFPNSIPMLCCYCYSFYYSEVIPENIKNSNCYLATWSKYHCKNINNEKMSCIKCGDVFWLKNNKLYCKNCKFEIEPNSIIWTCLICNSDFNSNAKIYNPLEFKEAQLILKEAFLYKRIVKPAELPCKCIINETQIEQIHFFHRVKHNSNTNTNNKECKGLLYYNEINNKKFIICSLCLNIYSITKFKWICPICFKPFTTSKVKIFHLKEKNNNINNANTIYKNKKIIIKNTKNTSKKKLRIISILDTENSYNSINNNSNNNNNNNRINNQKNDETYLSPNKNVINNYKIRNANSYIKKQPKDLNKLSSCYSSSSKDLKAKNNNNRINNKTISNNISFNNNHNGNRKKIHNIIRKNNTINNGCLYSLNIKKRRNLSEIPTELKSEIYYLITKNYKHENKYNSGTGSTIFSSLSNYNLNSPKETLIKATIDHNLNNSNNRTMKTVENNNPINKIINNNNNIFNLYKNNNNKKINNNDNEKNDFNYKSKKRNILISNNLSEIYQKKINRENLIKINDNNNYNDKNNYTDNNINTINNEYNCKIINNNILSPKNYKKIDYLKSLENKIDYNNENIFHKKLNKRQKGHKSFYIKDKKYILFSPENQIRNSTKNSQLNSKNIFKINDAPLDNKQKIPHKELNNSKNTNKNRNNLNKKKDDINYFNYSLNNNEYNKYNINNSMNSNINNINNLTINNNKSNSKYNIIHNNSINSNYNIRRKKNSSFEKINKVKIKNININIASPKINNNNYNLSFSTELKNVLLNKKKVNKKNNLSINSKTSNKENVSFTQTNISNSNNNENDNNKKLKNFNFDDYTIITQLGQGSFGKIYLVKDSNDNVYSMKKLLLSEELDVKSVLDEYNMCYNLSHPNIIKIIGVYSNKLDKTTYVVYVLMEVGISDWEKEINSFKAKKIFYSETDLINILKQLISALSFLQKKNISHRDIKPQNILIFKNKIYKLTDFGEARKIGEREKNKSLIQYSLKGTELYMSPLLFNGLRTGQIDIKHNTYKSDVYSLGLCLLYAATTNEKTLFEIRRIIEMDKIKKYVNYVLKDKYNDKLIDIICTMLEIYEEKRPDFIELEKLMENY